MINKKITIIGAGSACFSLGIIKDLCMTPSLQGVTVSFMDINEERLKAVHKLCTRYAKEIGMPLTIDMTTDRREALKGSDIVISTALAAPYSRMLKGWDIAREHGYQLHGSLHIMYDEAFWINFFQYRLYEQVTEDILDVCPNAWHLLVANPVITMVTHLKRKYPEANLVGICHGFGAVYGIASILGLEKDKVTFRAPGVNHFVWLSSFIYNGEDAYPLVDKWIDEKSKTYWEDNPDSWMGPLSKKCVDIYKKYGVLPIGDTAHWTGANWPWWYHDSDETNAMWAEGDPMTGWNGYLAWTSDVMKKMIDSASDLSVKVSDQYSGKTDEPIIPIVESLLCNKPKVHIVNVLNDKQFVPGIPSDFQVEIPGLVDKNGIHGIHTEPLPKSILAHTYRDRIAPVEMELAAYNNKSKKLLVDMVLMDRWSTSYHQAETFVDDILNMEGNEIMRDWYK